MVGELLRWQLVSGFFHGAPSADGGEPRSARLVHELRRAPLWATTSPAQDGDRQASPIPCLMTLLCPASYGSFTTKDIDDCRLRAIAVG